MKSIFLLLTFVVLSSAQLEYCDLCLSSTTKLATYLIQEDQLARQVEVLSAFVCEEVDDQCRDDIKKWWPRAARHLFAYEGTVPAICGDIGVCPPTEILVKTGQELTCDICNLGIEKLAQVFQSEKNVIRTINLLCGEAFCTEPSSGYGQECIDFVTDFTPVAMPVIAELFLDQQPVLCGEDVLGAC